MWQEALKLAVNNGLWAVLFLCLLIYQLKDSKERENKYQSTIKMLSTSLTSVQKIEKDVLSVKLDLTKATTKVVKIDKNVCKIKTDTSQLVFSNTKPLKGGGVLKTNL